MARGTVSLVFDDGYERVFQIVPPLLAAYNFPGVFAVALDGGKIQDSESRPVTPWQDWLRMRKEGHEIAAHSITHVNLKNLSPVDLDHELAEPFRLLSANTLVYPGGAYDSRVVKSARNYYSAGRTVEKRLEKIPPDDPLVLGTYNWHTNNWSVWKANLLALYTILTGRWLIETFHMVDDQENQMPHTVKASDLDRHLRFINRLPLSVKTIQDVINK